MRAHLPIPSWLVGQRMLPCPGACPAGGHAEWRSAIVGWFSKSERQELVVSTRMPPSSIQDQVRFVLCRYYYRQEWRPPSRAAGIFDRPNTLLRCPLTRSQAKANFCHHYLIREQHWLDFPRSFSEGIHPNWSPSLLFVLTGSHALLVLSPALPSQSWCLFVGTSQLPYSLRFSTDRIDEICFPVCDWGRSACARFSDLCDPSLTLPK